MRESGRVKEREREGEREREREKKEEKNILTVSYFPVKLWYR